VTANIQPPIYFPEGTSIPDATRMIYDALNSVHQRVLEYGPEAARWDYQRPTQVTDLLEADKPL